MVPPAAPAAVTHAGTASRLNDVLLAAAAFTTLGAMAAFAFGPDPARQPPPSPAAALLLVPGGQLTPVPPQPKEKT
jgi:hypothetical protein